MPRHCHGSPYLRELSAGGRRPAGRFRPLRPRHRLIRTELGNSHQHRELLQRAQRKQFDTVGQTSQPLLPSPEDKTAAPAARNQGGAGREGGLRSVAWGAGARCRGLGEEG